MTYEAVSEAVLKGGDEIAVYADKLPGKMHHGIYVETGVIHFYGSGSGIGSIDGSILSPGDAHESYIKEQILTDFKGGKQLYRVTHPGEQELTVCETVKRATTMLYNSWVFGEFHIRKNNCQHFAAWCKIDKKISDQVTEFYINASASAAASSSVASMDKE